MVYQENGKRRNGDVPIYSSIHAQSGLLRRRYSLPEIIIRKYHLSAQKQHEKVRDARISLPTAPTPPARENVPPSFIDRSSTSSVGSGGSDSNLSRNYPTHISMRRQLLRRIWSKECRRYDRTSSLSPPMRRTSRRMTFETPPSPEVCKECEKLEQQYKTSTEAIAAKQSRYSELPAQQNVQNILSSNQQQPQRPETIASATNISSWNSSHAIRATISTATSISSSGRAPSDSLDEIVTATAGDAPDNVYFVEIDDDQIHITTTASTTTGTNETSCDGGTSSVRSMYYSSAHIESINSRSTDDVNGNNNSGHVRATQQRVEQFIKDDGKQTSVVVANVLDSAVDMDKRDGNSQHIRASNGASNNNNNGPDPDTAIDKYISNLLIDSLNNVVIDDRGVNGRAFDALNGNECSKRILQKSETHTLDDVEATPMASTTDAYTNYEIFFPRYTAGDSPGNQSDCSTKYSNETDGFELPQNYMIAMNSGSNYPGYLDNNTTAMVVRRMIEMPRTESMEVQPSSASAPEDYKIESDEESVSLVDSLDDPIAVKRDDDKELAKDNSPRQKGEAFFVLIDSIAMPHEPIEENISPRVDASIAKAMPEKLREKLEKREGDRKRKEEEERKRFEYGPVDVVPKQERRRKFGRIETHFHPPGDASPSDATILPVASSSVGPIALKSKGRFLRSEIGLLESYTIDAQGNLKFKVQPAASTAAIRTVRKLQNNGTGKRNIVQHTVMKKVSSNKLQQSRNKKEIGQRAPLKTISKSSQLSSKVSLSSSATTKTTNDIQQMTLYHQSHSDIITPDADCGPRRMYQKTEIHDGEKRIEILEIVECLNSSPDDSEASPTSGLSSSDASFVPSLPTKYSRLSKIPVPVAALSANCSTRTRNANKEATTQSSLAPSSTSRETMASNVSGHLVKNLQQIGNNSKVDQIIADLLIEALNNSTEFGIEFVKTPLDGQLTAKRTKVSRRNGLNGSGKRSACSGKYQGVFDAIPEEKSNPSNEDRSSVVVTETSGSSTVVDKEMIPSEPAEYLNSSPESAARNLPTAASVATESVISIQSTATVASLADPNIASQSIAPSDTANSTVTTKSESIAKSQPTVKTASTAKSDVSTKTVSSSKTDSTAKSISITKSTVTTISTVSNGNGKSSTISSIVKVPSVNNSTNGSIKSGTTTSLSSIKSQTFNTSTNGSIKSPSTSSSATTSSSAATTIQSTARTNMHDDHSSAVSRGRAAIDEHIKPDAWFDCFGRSHTDSPIIDNKNPTPAIDEDKSIVALTEPPPNLDTSRTTISSLNSQTPSDTSYSTTTGSSTIEVHPETNRTKAESKVTESIVTDLSLSQSSTSTIQLPSTVSSMPLHTASSDTQQVLSLLDETFETSVTGNMSQSTADSTAIAKTTACHESRCAECEAIQRDIYPNATKVHESSNQIIEVKPKNGQMLTTKYPKVKRVSESVWQVGDIETTNGKFNKICLSPMSKSRSEMESPSSFIVIDKADNAMNNQRSNSLSPRIGGKLKPLKNSPTNEAIKSNRNECTDCSGCYFCKHEAHAIGCQDKNCPYCKNNNNQRPTKHQQKSSFTTRLHPNDAANKRSSNTERYLETRSKCDHSHTQIKSKDSDTISMKCRKVNRKVSRYIPLNNEMDTINGNDATPNEDTANMENNNISATVRDGTATEQPTISPKINDKKCTNSTIPKLPPSLSDWSASNSFDTSVSSSNDSPVFCASPRRRRQQLERNSVPHLPTAERWMNASNNNQSSAGQRARQNSRYEEFYGSKIAMDENNKLAEVGSVITGSGDSVQTKSSGWTVTLAGTYGDEITPDVEMRLSFPKKSPSPNNNRKVYKFPTHHSKSNYFPNGLASHRDGPFDEYGNGHHGALLPPPNNYNPKRSLSRNVIDENHLNYVNANNNSGGGNNNNINNMKRSKDCNLPDLKQQTGSNRIVAKHTAKKTIKRSEYSVAVASATRTISNFANGKRAMSFQALNANTYRIQNNPSRRDHSVDLSHLSSSHRGSPSPHYYQQQIHPNNYDYDSPANGMELSILGNAIAPERKPPVPTMSERDLTRRHHSCFIRNKPLFS